MRSHENCVYDMRSMAYLVALAPAAICALLSDKEPTRAPRVCARLVCLTDEREALERELGRVCKADAP